MAAAARARAATAEAGGQAKHPWPSGIPDTVTHSHAQSHTVTGSLCSRVQSRAVMRSHAVTRSHAQSRAVACDTMVWVLGQRHSSTPATRSSSVAQWARSRTALSP